MARPPGVMKYAWPMASTSSAPSAHQRAVGRGGAMRFSLPGGTEGLGTYRFTFRKRQRVAARIDHHAIAFAELAVEHLHRQRVQDAALDGPLERPGSIDRIIAFLDQLVAGGVGQLDPDLPLLQALQQAPDLDIHDLADVALR